jgi:hypothetical protein
VKPRSVTFDVETIDWAEDMEARRRTSTELIRLVGDMIDGGMARRDVDAVVVLVVVVVVILALKQEQQSVCIRCESQFGNATCSAHSRLFTSS